MNSHYMIRPAVADDLDCLLELLLALQAHLEAANPDLWRMKSKSRNSFKGQIAARLRSPDICVLVAEHDHEGVVGVIFGRVVTNNRYIPSQAGLVDQLFVKPEHRGGKIGSWLVAELCQFFAEQGVEDLSLRYVIGNQEASGFWTALGFFPRIVTAGTQRQMLEQRLARIEKS